MSCILVPFFAKQKNIQITPVSSSLTWYRVVGGRSGPRDARACFCYGLVQQTWKVIYFSQGCIDALTAQAELPKKARRPEAK